LEASLEATQKAVLARDLAELEQGTRDQMRLQRALAILWAEYGMPTQPSPSTTAWLQSFAPQFAAEWRAAQMRTLQLARVQAALLARAQRSLTMIANLLAGPESSYGSNPAALAAGPRSPVSRLGEEHPCQA
jgi:hypothetical protein